MKPGIHQHLSMPEYLAIDAANYSTLRYFARSAAHAQEQMLHPTAPTPAMELGSAVHAAVLEPERFKVDYVEGIKVDRRTKAGKAEWSDFESSHPTATILKPDDHGHCLAIQAAAWNNPTIADLLGGPGMNEVAIVWDDEATGERCKARIDRLTEHLGWTVAVDLKTTRDASTEQFSRSIANYGYHEQAAFYLAGLNVLAPRKRRFMFVAIETSPPYASATYRLDRLAIEIGEQRVRKYLARYAECKRSGVWAGYDPAVQQITLPPWAISYQEVA